MGILNGIKTRKVNGDLDVFETVGNYKVFEPNEEIWKQVVELFSQADQDRIEDGQYVSTFGKEATIQLFRLLTNIDMTEKMYDTYATKRNVRLMLVQQYIIEVVQTYLKLGMITIENEKLSQDIGVESKPKNRNDKTVILEQMKKNETERKAQEIVAEGIENGHIVEVSSDHIAEVSKKVDAMTDDELDIELARLEKIAKIKKLQAELGE